MIFIVPLQACSPAHVFELARANEVAASNVSGRCPETIAAVRKSVLQAGASDAEAAPVSGFPIFRVNRFLAALGERAHADTNSKVLDAWAGQLLLLDERATQHEIENLPPQHYRRLAREIFGRRVHRREAFERWRACARDAARALLANRKTRRDLVKAAKVEDNYSEAARFAGLFAISSIPVAAGWERWKAEHLPTFEQRPAELRVRGRLVEFSPSRSGQPMGAREVRDIIARSRGKLLDIPQPRGRDLQRLLEAFAPHWVFDVAGSFDLPGYPVWNSAGAVAVDIARPTVFTRVSHAMIGSRVVLQLNYSVWFQERPRNSPADLLGGALDGIIWRVTLGDDGRPLVYDSIHACGCYHLVFPVRASTQRTPVRARQPLQELPAILSVAPKLGAGERIALRVASQSHYLQAVAVARPGDKLPSPQSYSMAGDDKLRSLPLAQGGKRSLYGPDGLVAGTERLERFLLWPTGVLSPGAMRQWGHHAIAFADKRHFDDPNLFETILGW